MHANIDSRPPQNKAFYRPSARNAFICSSSVRSPHPGRLSGYGSLCAKEADKPIAARFRHARRSLTAAKNANSLFLITTSPKHTQQKPLDLPHHLPPPTKNRSCAPHKQANQTLYSLSQHLKPTQHMLRPLRKARLSDISAPLNISDISAPTQPNNAIIGIRIQKSPRFQINRLRTTPIKQQINDHTSLLFSTTPLNPRRNGLLFQQNPRRTTQTKPDKPIAAPHKTTPKPQHSAPHHQNAPRAAVRKAKGTTISHPNPSLRQEKQAISDAIPSVF